MGSIRMFVAQHPPVTGSHTCWERPIANIDQSSAMLRSQPELPKFAATPKSDSRRTHRLRDGTAVATDEENDRLWVADRRRWSLAVTETQGICRFCEYTNFGVTER